MKHRKRGRKSKQPNKETFEMMYYNPTTTVYELSEYYKVSIHTIYKWAYQFRKGENNNA